MGIAQRKRPGASGKAIRLSDGRDWLFATPYYMAGRPGLTEPCIDRWLDDCFDASVTEVSIGWDKIFAVAYALLVPNYFLSDDEAVELLTFAPADAKAFSRAILDLMFGEDDPDQTYTLWVRASLLANGLAGSEIPAVDIDNVLAILVATRRTVPLSKFADACKDAEERRALAMLRASTK